MTEKLKKKLATLPADPGVYFHRDAKGKIIYIGKAAVLKNRVMSYFQNKHRDPKTNILVANIVDTDWIIARSEVEALFLESEFIKRYKPKFNIDLKDDKNFLYVKISSDPFPVVTYVRRPLDDKSHYYGPFTSSDALRRAMRLLRKVFPYVTHEHWPKRGCLQYHLGLCPGPEEGAITKSEYARTVRRLEMYLKGEQTKLMSQLEKEMQKASARQNFEAAAHFRNQLQDLKSFSKQMIFKDTEAFDLSRDQSLTGLAELLALPRLPRRIEAYDISHLGGQDNVASMVVFSDGVPNRDAYRRFKMRVDKNNDVEHIAEVIARRFGPAHASEWPLPDLVVVDGGQHQLASALKVMGQMDIQVPAIGLAKRREEIIQRLPSSQVHNPNFESILLPPDSHVLHLLQRVRDEAHRFAINYQTLLRGKRGTASLLDSVPGVGPATKRSLIRKFGSVQGVRAASLSEVAACIGQAKAAVVKEHLGQSMPDKAAKT